jgi:murein DD-endopeptidase MepM/ murein hydrolase activator NlpD
LVMRSRFVMSFSGSASRIAVAAALAATLAACGTDVSRFADTPFQGIFDPSGRTDPDVTASLAPPAAVAQGSLPAQGKALNAPAGTVSAAPLAPVSSAPLASPVTSAPLAAPQALPPVAQAASPQRVQGMAPAGTPAPVQAAAAGWTAQGGSAVTLGQGETVKTLAARYGVPEAAIRSANNISGNPAPGARIVIPVYHANAPVMASAPAKAQPMAAPSPTKQMAQPAPVQAAPQKQVAAAQPQKTDLPQRPVQPGKTDLPQRATLTAPAEPVKQAKVEPAAQPQKGKQATPAAEPAPVAPVTTAPTAKEETTASLGAAATSTGGTEFRWPAKGRIIQGFGPGSDGINIALPEGTPVKAVENGVVAYAGNELKGYGNLVLIRHDNGFVSAYANNGELKVKRGEQVKRGQTVALSGQSGNVSSPQLHFELRKGSTPVDPMPYLAGGG